MLTQHGIDQARMLGSYLSEHKIIPARVYSSPAVRTVRTATLALEAMGLDISLATDEALLEMDQGDWVGRIRNEHYLAASQSILGMTAEIKRCRYVLFGR